MSANEPLKALSRILCTRGPRGPACCRLTRSEWPEPAICRRSGFPRAAVSNTILIAALSLCLVGCGVLQTGTTARPTPPQRTDTKGAQELASATKQPEAPSRSAQPAPQPARRVSETKPPPASVGETRPPSATASRGAEKLVAPSAPAPVRASQRTTLPAEPSAPKAPTAEDSGTVTGAPVQALVFRGPPPQARSRRAGVKLLAWLGLGLGGAALAVLARLYLIRRATPPALPDAKKDELKTAPGLLMKEPLNLPQKAVMAEES